MNTLEPTSNPRIRTLMVIYLYSCAPSPTLSQIKVMHQPSPVVNFHKRLLRPSLTILSIISQNNKINKFIYVIKKNPSLPPLTTGQPHPLPFPCSF